MIIHILAVVLFFLGAAAIIGGTRAAKGPNAAPAWFAICVVGGGVAMLASGGWLLS